MNKLFKISFKKNKMAYILLIVSQIVGAVCLMLSYGIFTAYEGKKQELVIDSRTIAAEFKGVSVGEIKDIITDICDDIENNLSYFFVMTSFKEADGKEAVIIGSHNEYHNGRYCPSETIRNNLDIKIGRYFNESDYEPESMTVITDSDYAVGDLYYIGGVPYEVIGNAFMNILLPFGKMPDEAQVHAVMFNFNELPDYSEYKIIKNSFVKNLEDRVAVDEFNVLDEDTLISIRSVIFISVITGLVTALDSCLVFGYLIKIRRRELLVMGLVGAGKKKRFVINMREIAAISAVTLITGFLIMHFIFERIYYSVYDTKLDVFSLKRYVLMGSIYYICIILFSALTVYFNTRTSIKEMLRRTCSD